MAKGMRIFMGKTPRIMMFVGVILASYALLKVAGLMASMMFRMFFPAAILVLAAVVFYAGYRMRKGS